MTYVLNWGVFFEELPGGGEQYWQLIVSGIYWTLAVSACSWVIALALGSVIGTIRTTTNPWLVHFGNAWVELFRNIPLLVQMFLWYFVIPEFIPPLKSWIVHTDPANAGCSRRRASPSRSGPAFKRCLAGSGMRAWRWD